MNESRVSEKLLQKLREQLKVESPLQQKLEKDMSSKEVLFDRRLVRNTFKALQWRTDVFILIQSIIKGLVCRLESAGMNTLEGVYGMAEWTKAYSELAAHRSMMDEQNSRPLPVYAVTEEEERSLERLNAMLSARRDALEKRKAEAKVREADYKQNELFKDSGLSHGRYWFRHIPGNPIPCDEEEHIHVLTRYRAEILNDHIEAWEYDWSSEDFEGEVIGWMYADKEKRKAAVERGTP